jgi:hypothetical protein
MTSQKMWDYAKLRRGAAGHEPAITAHDGGELLQGICLDEGSDGRDPKKGGAGSFSA